MDYVLLHLRWKNMLRGVVRKGIAHFCVAFSYGSASSHHDSKCFIQKVLSHFILLYFACCWDFSGTSVHTCQSLTISLFVFMAAAIF